MRKKHQISEFAKKVLWKDTFDGRNGFQFEKRMHNVNISRSEDVHGKLGKLVFTKK